ncbi:hypothetical protein BDE36_4616 [Arcticibacter tournemirensis]|nr:hypothetical protein BDE36_4616 [Arcticibacter tournemirensis]
MYEIQLNKLIQRRLKHLVKMRLKGFRPFKQAIKGMGIAGAYNSI